MLFLKELDNTSTDNKNHFLALFNNLISDDYVNENAVIEEILSLQSKNSEVLKNYLVNNKESVELLYRFYVLYGLDLSLESEMIMDIFNFVKTGILED